MCTRALPLSPGFPLLANPDLTVRLTLAFDVDNGLIGLFSGVVHFRRGAAPDVE